MFSLKSYKKYAFTLAEVLITLGIIGVVAAMTIPTLTKTYRHKLVETRLKAAYSMFAQAIKLSEIDHGSIEQWERLDADYYYSDISDKFAQEYLLKYIKGVKSINEPSWNSYRARAFYTLQNGTMIYIWARGTWGEIGIYPESKAGQGKSFVLVYSMYPSTTMYHQTHAGLAFYGEGFSIDTLKNNGTYGCYSTTGAGKGAFCGALIKSNNWKIPDDYPW